MSDIINNVGSLTREQKLEIMVKAGLMLRKELRKSQEAFGEVKMRAYLCPIEAIEQFDKVLEAISKTDSKKEE